MLTIFNTVIGIFALIWFIKQGPALVGIGRPGRTKGRAKSGLVALVVIAVLGNMLLGGYLGPFISSLLQ